MKIKICPKCKAHNTESAILCAECYASLNGVVPVEDTGERPAKRVKICPKCGAENGVTAVICGSCYASLTDVVPSTETTASAPQFKTCPNCGTQNAVGATRCKTCYKPFEEQAENKPRSTQTQPVSNTTVKPSDILPNSEDLNKHFGSNSAKTCKTMGFAYREKNFGIFENDVKKIKDMVFNAPFITSYKDYYVFKDKTAFLYKEKDNNILSKVVDIILDEKLKSQSIENVFACCIDYLQSFENFYDEEGKLDFSEYKKFLSKYEKFKYLIVVSDGFGLAVSAVVAAYVKFNPDLNFSAPEKMREVFTEINKIYKKNNYNFDTSALRYLDEKFDLIPDNSEQIRRIKAISLVALAFAIAHEFGHIVSGHTFQLREINNPRYSRNNERTADKFAIDTINSMGDEVIKNFIFLGALMLQLTLASMTSEDMALELPSNSNSSHPAELERFRMLMEGTKATNHFGFTEEKYISCIPLK